MFKTNFFISGSLIYYNSVKMEETHETPVIEKNIANEESSEECAVYESECEKSDKESVEKKKDKMKTTSQIFFKGTDQSAKTSKSSSVKGKILQGSPPDPQL